MSIKKVSKTQPESFEFSQDNLKEAANKPTAHSRLGCQIELKKEYNNITVTIAPE